MALRPWSCNNVLNQAAVNVSQSEVTTTIPVRELFVVKAHQVKNRGVQIVDMDGFVNDFVAEVIRSPIGDAPLHTASRQQH